MKYANIVKPNPATVRQTAPLDERQVKNDAGGFVYSVGKWGQLDRFLILGAEGGTFYVKQDKHVKRNYTCLKECLKEDGLRTVARIVDVSVRGLAPKQDHAIFALAVAAASDELPTRTAALAAVNEVCRTASTFFAFLEELKSFRSLTGRAIRRVVKQWYDAREVDQVAFQAVKYRSRSGWSHADALRVGHPSPNGDMQRSALYRWIVDDVWPSEAEQPRIVEGYLAASKASSSQDIVRLITDYKLPREAVPTQFLGSANVWSALLPHMPLTALVRNLGNMTKSGLLSPGSEATQAVLSKLDDESYIKKSRVHPIQVLVAMKTYQSGRGLKGDGTWNPVSSIVASLDDAFYKAFANVAPTGKRFLIGLDVSGSMAGGYGASLPGGLSPCEAVAAMSMVWAATEPTCEVMGFADRFVQLGFNRKMSLSEAMRKAQMNNFGRTDCALPMLYAAEQKQQYDVFIVMTDNETYFGSVHPKVALADYRKKYVSDARQIVLATSATNFSIADPTDPLALDIAGFSADVPQVISAFIGGPSSVPASVSDED
ncbi:MAG: TROVE domain-containing protein [Armatimonadetes bacterium]|nr:TROVE domain-containing protein [Armatimonadota bacterium]